MPNHHHHGDHPACCYDDHGPGDDDHLTPRYDDGDFPRNDAAELVNTVHNLNITQLYPDQPYSIADVEHLHDVTGRILDEHRRRHPGDLAGDRV